MPSPDLATVIMHVVNSTSTAITTWVQADYFRARANGEVPTVTNINHNKLCKMRQFLGFISIKITWKMSENYCSHLENKPLSAKAWQRYAFLNLS